MNESHPTHAPNAPPADLSFQSPLPLLCPPSIAIVGASERAKWPTLIYRNLRDFGYPGKIYPVNPRGGEVWGAKLLSRPRLAAGAARRMRW